MFDKSRAGGLQDQGWRETRLRDRLGRRQPSPYLSRAQHHQPSQYPPPWAPHRRLRTLRLSPHLPRPRLCGPHPLRQEEAKRQARLMTTCCEKWLKARGTGAGN